MNNSENKKFDAIVVGGGISGCTVARKLADSGSKVLIIEKNKHIGGLCYDKKDDAGILIHLYGPHIFHTNHEEVYDYLSKFTSFSDYKHKVITNHKGKLFPMPINLKTCNLFFNKDFDSESLKEFLEDKREKIQEIKNSRDVVVSKFGEELYEAFVKHYTKKQWDMYPEELDKSVLERLPIRYNNDDLYFNDKYQGIPTEGYTPIFKKMIDHENISIIYETDYKDSIDDYEYKVLIITSSIDEYFNYKFTKLKYRSMDFVFETHDIPRFQENSVINFPDPDVDYTRITEFKHLTGQKHPKTTIYKEKPKWEGIQMYPIPQEQTKEIYNKYYKEAKKLKNIYFLGRLGKYKYINMDVACKEALELSNVIIQNLSKN